MTILKPGEKRNVRMIVFMHFIEHLLNKSQTEWIYYVHLFSSKNWFDILAEGFKQSSIKFIWLSKHIQLYFSTLSELRLAHISLSLSCTKVFSILRCLLQTCIRTSIKVNVTYLRRLSLWIRVIRNMSEWDRAVRCSGLIPVGGK